MKRTTPNKNPVKLPVALPIFSRKFVQAPIQVAKSRKINFELFDTSPCADYSAFTMASVLEQMKLSTKVVADCVDFKVGLVMLPILPVNLSVKCKTVCRESNQNKICSVAICFNILKILEMYPADRYEGKLITETRCLFSFTVMKQVGAIDATTNPSILLAASRLNDYKHFLDKGVAYAKKFGSSLSRQEMCALAMDKIAVLMGKEVLSVVPGRVSTEVDARLAFDKDAQIEKALAIIKLYEEEGIAKERVLIKIPSSWEGIQAARVLESKHGVHCNMTLLFNIYQAIACAEANATLISPFVGRIRDWYLKNTDAKDFTRETDPGVQSVRKIYGYYKKYGYKTEVMAASFRNLDEIKGLIGCDLMTISAALLKDLSVDSEQVPVILNPERAKSFEMQKISLSEPMFRYEMNEDKMATDLLADGIRRFVADARAMEDLIDKAL
uniref:Transaldolase n=1 Tax=Setaria digitata TaxID=48799 RepID=A0A915PGF0_9BILA